MLQMIMSYKISMPLNHFQRKSSKNNTHLSAFSLIEVLVALLVLSIGALGASRMLLESTACYQKVEWREKVVTIGWSIADSLVADQSEQTLRARTQYWQKKLDVALPGNVLTINRENLEGKCFYIVRISSVVDLNKIFELRIYSHST